MAEDMIKAGSIGEKQFDDFVSQRLITHSVAFFSPIKRNNLKTGIKKVKPSPKAVTILKEDCQAFGVIISKSLSLSEAFQHPITSLPLSIATPDGELRQSDKASLRNFLKDHAKATSTVAPKQAAWFVDGLASIRTFKRKETYEKWMEGLLQFITPSKLDDPTMMGMINDTYLQLNAKTSTRKKRGEKTFTRTHVEGRKQHMPTGIEWQEFLCVGENKEQLLVLLSGYVENIAKKQLLPMPLIFTAGDQTIRLENGRDSVRTICNHEEADTRLVLQAFEEESDAVIVSKDSDVLILLVWAYVFYDIQKEWYLKYENEKYANIRLICDTFGRELCLALPAFHALTGCDTTSYFFKAGKLRVLKKIMTNNSKVQLLKPLGREKHLNLLILTV